MTQISETIAIIPARGGSKGIPRKNFLPLAGKPLVAHSILQAQQVPAISRVIVSTDDEEIAAVSREWKAEVILRPAEISGDTASSESALLHVLDSLKEKEGFEPELVVFLQATSPMRAPDNITCAIEALKREGADSLFSSCRVEGFTWRLAGGIVKPVDYDPAMRPRRQDLPGETWEENGSFYLFKPWVLRKFNSRLGGKISLYRMSVLDSFQIDEPGDFEFIEHLMKFERVEGQSLKMDKAAAGEALLSALKKVRLLVLDFDGVMTDNRVLVTEDGKEAVFCDRSDGLGLEMLRRKGIEAVVISKERNPVVSRRCLKLGIECLQGCDDKLATLRKKAEAGNLKPEELAYVGNDVNDLECLRWVGMPIAVADAVPEVRAVAKWVTAALGGRGAVREACDLFLSSR
jgi:YrbI family 3-deoxy-D-manno-octulosonate 8-phosphate phosphatase